MFPDLNGCPFPLYSSGSSTACWSALLGSEIHQSGLKLSACFFLSLKGKKEEDEEENRVDDWAGGGKKPFQYIYSFFLFILHVAKPHLPIQNQKSNFSDHPSYHSWPPFLSFLTTYHISRIFGWKL